MTVAKKTLVVCLIALLVFGMCQGFLLVSRPVRGALVGTLGALMVGIVLRYRWKAARRLEEVPLVLDDGQPQPLEPREEVAVVVGDEPGTDELPDD